MYITWSDELCRANGMLVSSWPATIGAEACGVVLETGPGCSRYKSGDCVYGLVRLGSNAYAPYQETFLADEDLFFKKAERISMEEASVVGVGLIVSFLILMR